MEGKKIAFIVVSIVAIGSIGYYLYNKNKQVATSVATDKPLLSKEGKIKLARQQATKSYIGRETSTPTANVPVGMYDDAGRK